MLCPASGVQPGEAHEVESLTHLPFYADQGLLGGLIGICSKLMVSHSSRLKPDKRLLLHKRLRPTQSGGCL
jgi:hypothetical protein